MIQSYVLDFLRSKLNVVIIMPQGGVGNKVVLFMYVMNLLNLKNNCEPLQWWNMVLSSFFLRENGLLGIYFQVLSTHLYHCLWK